MRWLWALSLGTFMGAVQISQAQALTDEEKTRIMAELATVSDEQYNAAFRCPEDIPEMRERVLATVYYFNWAYARHPEWDARKMVNHRLELLITHHCVQTLKNIGIGQPHP